ncbi:MAG: shikimate dehydrogenase [Rhizobiales bacterium NRL2]|jgi:shikimate dehydrogenase|nr:MAG: shikimate dehydrogenase [Rhizobiales bacterium NRL2]
MSEGAPTGAAKVAGVTGWPVEHSLSPRLHGFWLRRHGVDGVYAPFPVVAGAFETAIRGLAAAGLSGVNVTVPHKRRAFEIADELDAAARAIGAVNTLVFRDGRILGRNTDAPGFMANLRQHGVDPAVGPVTVIGAGGAARAALHALLQAGVSDIRLVNRTPESAWKLAHDAGNTAVTVKPYPVSEAVLRDTALLVNTTSLGMTGQAALEIDLSPLPETAVVHDIVYVPLETPLLAAARARGLKTVDGLGMLLHQAAPAFEAFYGVRPEVDTALRRHLLEVL